MRGQALAASRWRGGYPQLSRQAIAASRWKGGYPQLPRQAIVASRWKGGYPQLPRQAIVASRWKGGQISTITPIGGSCQKMERWIHNYDYPDMHWLPVGGEVDRDQQLPGVTREKYSPRQNYSRVKMVHADFTPSTPERQAPNTRELLSREFYSREKCGLVLTRLGTKHCRASCSPTARRSV